MHILIVTQYFWPEDFRINDLALGLKEKGHRITVLTGIPNYPKGNFFPGYRLFKPRRENFKGINVIRIPLVPRGRGQGWLLALNYLSFAIFSTILAPLYCRFNFDVIFVCQYSPVTVAIPAIIIRKIKNLPLILWVQDLWPESLSATGAVKSNVILSIVGKLVNFIYRNCDNILVQSKAFYPWVEKAGIKTGKIHYFPNWAETLYKPVNFGEAKNLHMPDGFRIMFAGNIGAAQDFETILAVAEKLKVYQDIHWIILGDGRLREWVEKQVQSRGLNHNVHLLGRHPTEEMPDYFAYADAMLVTLKKEPIFAITIPSKVQSYLACAKPIIAALDGEGANVVKEAGAGLTCPAEDVDALAEAILQIYQMTDQERKAMGLQGRAYYEKCFEREKLLGKLENWMAEIIKTKP